jgi:siroheme synthase (precorrin-2 oxidase/ferrochelatase)
MGILSSSVSITQYRVEGKFDQPVIETVAAGLKKYAVKEIDNESDDKAVGWACLNAPFSTDFDQSPFLFGTHFVFCLRIDKKNIPAKVVSKHYSLAMIKRLKSRGREFLNKTEKKELKEQIIQMLSTRIPATPNIYDLIWNYESGRLWFLSNLKNANEELETLFARAFSLRLIRLFPYTMATLTSPLSASRIDAVNQFTPTRFTA